MFFALMCLPSIGSGIACCFGKTKEPAMTKRNSKSSRSSGGSSGHTAHRPRGDITPANATDGSSDAFAGGGHASGRNAIKPGTHGASPRARGDSTDHSGKDASTVSPNAAGSVKPMRGDDPGAEGEVNL